MSDWKPKPVRGLNLTQLPLSMEAGFVMSRLDGATRAAELGLLTGLPADRIQDALRQLLQHGALEALGAPPDLLPAPPEVASEPEEAPADDSPEPEQDRGDYQALYGQRFRNLSGSERAGEAQRAQGDVLNALCLDPLPEVIRAVLENSGAGPTQARLIARHHHTAIGINCLLGHAEYCRDDQVRRLLLRNPQLAEPMLARLYAGRRLKEIHAVAQSREVTDQTRRGSRNLLRQRFSSAPSEEKVEVIWATEGRVLSQLIGVGLDGKSAQLLSERTYASLLLIQNLGKWPPTPTPLLRHLLNQPLVRRQASVKALLKRHPNAPKEP